VKATARPGRATGSFTAGRIAQSWKEALTLWDVLTELSPPKPYSGKGKSHWQSDDPLAFIDLETRQVVVNFPLLEQIGAAGSLTGVLAHEIGHHVRFPHTLGLVAVLQVLEKRLIPGLRESLTNLFFDLQVNEVVGRTRASELQAVYRGFVRDSRTISPVFFFYLAIYEELWGLEPGSLVPPARIQGIEKSFPGCRADARVFAQTFYALPTVYLQFTYFCSRMIRYIEDPGRLKLKVPLGADVGQPDADDYDRAIAGVPGVDEAVEEARSRGWIEDSGALDRDAGDPFSIIDRITAHAPGTGGGELRQALVEKHYRRLIEPHLLRIPGESPVPEAFLPTIPEDWEVGDSPSRIDWPLTVIERGPLAGIRPLQRELEPDDPPAAEGNLPALEIYLDTSGSMPDPQYQLNAMTLAAQILSASAIRRGGSVRGIIYSSGTPSVSDWMRDEEVARRFLLGYVGGGTDYPFGLLRESAEERRDVIRVIVSDSDFLHNVGAKGAQQALAFGTGRSRLLVAFLAVPNAERARKAIGPAGSDPRFRLAVVKSLTDFGSAASQLADAILS